MTATVEHAPPMILDEVEVTAVERLSPTYARIELGGPVLADFGVDGPLYDQRIKLVFPNAAGRLASFAGADEDWYSTWLGIPSEERGHMRTYTVREVRGEGVDTRLVVDFVLHLEGDAVGPGSAWAATARPGDRLVVMAPRRGMPFGGIEFAPGRARELLLVADETAVPAVASILADLPDDARGAAYLEVPVAGDVQDLDGPAGVQVSWLTREGARRGELLTAAVIGHLGTGGTGGTGGADLVQGVADDDIDPDLWETPTHSSSGETLPAVRPAGHDLDGLYAWIAGESKVVTGLRRHLVKDVGVDRSRVAFMGYWREGVAMRS
jgi:NADPH-dependent ferric siderophore reductase